MNRRLVLLGGAGVSAAAAVGVAVAAGSTARRIRGLPDPVPLEDLLREPPGEDPVVDRPDGTRLRVRVAGSGPTVVLAHGIALTLGEWNLVADAAARRRVPGRGVRRSRARPLHDRQPTGSARR